jgi:hypothetical protein
MINDKARRQYAAFAIISFAYSDAPALPTASAQSMTFG